MQDVGQLAGVSMKTVSNVLNDHPYVSAETRRKVMDAVEALGYTPNLSARSLRSGRTDVIALAIPDLRNAYFAELAHSVVQAASNAGLSVMIEEYGNERARELAVLTKSRSQMVDGVLHSVMTLGPDDAEVIASVPGPLVLLGDRMFGGVRDHVTMRNVEAAHAATEHLLGLGRTRIVALGAHPGEAIGSAALRLVGYRQALSASGVPFEKDLIVPVMAWHRHDGADAMREFLTRGVPFDSVVAFNDAIAFGALRALQEFGRRVPEDVAVIGFDDIDETRYSMPALSTVHPGREEIARIAVELLVQRIRQRGSAFQAEEIAVPFRLIERESTGATEWADDGSGDAGAAVTLHPVARG